MDHSDFYVYRHEKKITLYYVYDKWKVYKFANGMLNDTKNYMISLKYPFMFDLVSKKKLILIYYQDQFSIHKNMFFTQHINKLQKDRDAFVDMDMMDEIDVIYNTNSELVIERDRMLETFIDSYYDFVGVGISRNFTVTYYNEPGIDDGGLSRDLFSVIGGLICDPKRTGWITHNSNTWIPYTIPDSDVYKTAVTDGELVMDLIIMVLGSPHNLNINLNFPLLFYKKLLGLKTNFDDFKVFEPDLSKKYEMILKYDGDVQEDLDSTFFVRTIIENDVIEIPTYDSEGVPISFETDYDKTNKKIIEHPLIKDGENMPITNDNRKFYVDLATDFLMNTSVEPFFRGLSKKYNTEFLEICTPEELQILICGEQVNEIIFLANDVKYIDSSNDPYSATNSYIIAFWEIVNSLTRTDKLNFLEFIAGSKIIPAGGIANMELKIMRTNNVNQAPSSHSCNYLLGLPRYDTLEILRERLMIAIEDTTANKKFTMKSRMFQ